MTTALLGVGDTAELFAGKWLVTLSAAAADGPVSGRLFSTSADHRFQGRMVDDDGPAPATFEARKQSVVFEGFLYCRPELRAQLGLESGTSASDAELVLRAYERWGIGACAHLKGIFAFCLWDALSERLLAARDRLGTYPLFYSRRGSKLYLSPLLDAFAAPHGPGLEVDRAVVAGLLARHQPDLQETFYRGVQRVPPGHLLIQQGPDGARVERYWKLQPVGAGSEWVEEAELFRFGELMDQAVGRALERGPAAIFLSGGLDSVSVAASASQHAALIGQPPPLALSLLFPGEVSEEGTQRGVARMLGMEQRFLGLEEAVAPAGLVARSLEFSASGPAPLQNVWRPAYERLALEGKSRGRRVVLTGGGGDEWLTVSPVIAADLIRSLDLRGLLHYVATLQRSLHLRRGPLLRNVLWTNGLGKLLRMEKQRLLQGLAPGVRRARLERSLAHRLSNRSPWVAPDSAIGHALDRRVERRFWELSAGAHGPGAGGYYFSDRNSDLDHPLLAIDAEEIFANSRSSGVMQFDTYWDADLVEFLYRVPPHLLNKGGRSKGLVRSELARRFPGLGFDRQKKLVSRDFFCSLLFSQGPSAWKSLGGTPALADLGLVEPAGLEEFVRGVLANRDERGVDDFWRVMSLESWVRPRV